MKKALLAFLLAMCIIGSASAVDVKFKNVPDSWGVFPEAAQDELKAKIEEKYGKYESGDDLGRAISNAGALAADGGYMKSVYGYDWISVAVSAFGAVSTKSISEMKDFIDDYRDDGDVYFGAGVQMINAAVGFNLGHLLKWDHGLYLTLKGGLTKFSYDDYDLDSFNLGFMVNYQLVEAKGLGKGHAIKWRGLNVGAGFTYYKSVFEFTVDDLEEIRYDVYKYNADLDVEVEATRFIIPVEISTGIKLAIFDLFGGIGADFMFGGKTEITADSDGTVKKDGADGKANGVMHMSAEGDEDYVKLKYTVGIGFSLGPVHIEIPYTQYFDSNITSSIGIIGGVAF